MRTKLFHEVCLKPRRCQKKFANKLTMNFDSSPHHRKKSQAGKNCAIKMGKIIKKRNEGMIRDFFMALLMIFYIFMKLIFLPKNSSSSCPRCAELQQQRSARKKSFKMHEKKSREIYFDFFLKVADIVCAIIVHFEILMGFL